MLMAAAVGREPWQPCEQNPPRQYALQGAWREEELTNSGRGCKSNDLQQSL